MEISYLGHSSFKLRGKNAIVVTDPYDSQMTGLKFPKHVSADIITVSHDHKDHNAVSLVEGTPFVIRGPGEYEVKGVGIIGLATFHDAEKGAQRGRNTVYRIEIDGISIAHLGDLGHTLSSAEIDSLDGVDVLLIPVGGVFTIDGTTAATLVKSVEPAIVIPMHYGRAELKIDLAPVSVFLKEMGKEGIVPQTKLTLTKDKIPEEMQVIILE